MIDVFSKIKKVVLWQTRPFVPLMEWNALLGALMAKIVPLSNSSEEKFLSIGSALQGFTTRARELSEMSASAARLTSGEVIGAAIKRLREQLDRMTQYLDSSGNKADGDMKKLQYILSINDGLDAICNEFNQTARVLQCLSVSTQIENARYSMQNDSGFNIISENVKRLAELIETKSTRIMENSKNLAALVQSALCNTQELINQQRGHAVKMLNDAQSSVESLTNLNKNSSGLSNSIAKRSSEICQNIGNVVTSMQFQDITRQEMEHVAKELKKTMDSIERFDCSGNELLGVRQLELAASVGRSCRAQSAQLLRTRDELVTSVDCVVENLLGISKNVQSLVEETQSLSGSAHQSDATLLSQVEAGISAVIQSLNENVRRGREISASVSGAVDGMMEFVKDIEAIGTEIELIAFNAQVKAKRAGDEGRTLGVLADGIQRLASDAKRHTGVVLGKLRAITVEAEVFHDNDNSAFGQTGTEAKGIAETLENLLGALHRLNAEFAQLLAQIAANGDTLAEEIEETANHTVFHIEMDIAILDIAAELSGMVAQAQILVPSLDTDAVTDDAESRRETPKEWETNHLEYQRVLTSAKTGADTPGNGGVEVAQGGSVELF